MTTFEFNWKKLPLLIPSLEEKIQPGLAGAISGTIFDELIIAGGSNFPDTLPWLGGTKKYYDELFFIKPGEAESRWQISSVKLPKPMAYTACLSKNNSIYCVGGENINGPVAQVLKISKKNNAFVFEKLPDFPVAVSNAGISTIDNKIFVVGGLESSQAVSSFYCANIAEEIFSWKKLPDLPVPLSHAVVVGQWDGTEKCIYVLGGRNKTGNLTKFFSAIWKYSPSKKNWQKTGEIACDKKNPLPLAAGTGIAFGENFILLFGGDNGKLFNKTEEFNIQISEEKEGKKKQNLVEQKINHLTSHPGFCRDIFIFNTLTNKCISTDKIPFPAQVTTSLVKIGDTFYIPNGEIKPGVRTAEINCTQVLVNVTHN